MMNGGFLDNPGLYTGEMGLVLFFYLYADYTGNEVYWDYALELLEKVQDRINVETPIDYKNGLAGIGSTIEYLVQQGYIEADTDEILEDFDDRMFSVRNVPQMSAEEIISIAIYAIWRLSGSKSKNKLLLNKILPPLINAMDEWCASHDVTLPMVPYLKHVVEDETQNLSFDSPLVIPGWNHFFCKNSPYCSIKGPSPRFLEIMAMNDIFNPKTLDLGFPNGLAGIGMTLLTELNEDSSWTSLIQNDLIPIKNESIPV